MAQKIKVSRAVHLGGMMHNALQIFLEGNKNGSHPSTALWLWHHSLIMKIKAKFVLLLAFTFSTLCFKKKFTPRTFMKTNLNNIWQKCTWQNLQQNYMQQMWDLFVERRYFKFQNEIQFSSNSIMEQLKHRDSDSFYDSFWDRNMSCFYQVLHHITCMTGLC